ncbi:beta-ketoacyl synthase chain length factor [Salinicola avicenniae]|uniref:beta-ketoacyl synthase chain length factor n=1 Tax=Salinicola avicenniae TaxID=2916836 RepID=UPI002074A071|nr:MULTISPECIES: beta-ketoacyl synthase chain length factor [unclassified Salinicola]
MTDLYLQDWRGWTPHRDAAGNTRLDTRDKPAGTAIPAMLRRRLNLIGRAVCDMLLELDPASNHVVLHASRHGDGDRTLEMLYALDDGDPLSPARFGLSVHNATIGVYSIASGNRRSQQAIAASGAEWGALMAEARGYLADGESSVLVVFGDQPVPERFAAYAPNTLAAAVALRLGLVPGADTRRLVDRSLETGPDHALLPAPQPLDIIDWLTGQQAFIRCARTHREWCWEPASDTQ